MQILRSDNLVKRYKSRTVVDNVSIRVQQGEIVGLLGFAVWTYGFGLYLASGLPFAALAIYFPQMLFWTFWYIGVKRFYFREDTLLHGVFNGKMKS